MNKKIVDYRICIGEDDKDCPSVENLKDWVVELLSMGWQPYGNPYLDKYGDHCQAMVKYIDC